MGLRIGSPLRLWSAQHRTPLTICGTTLSAFALALFFQSPIHATLTATALDPAGHPLTYQWSQVSGSGAIDGWLRWASLVVFVASSALTVFLSITPQYYERVKYAASLLPAICDILHLDNTARVAIHHIRSTKSQTYEQVTPYHPTNTGQGRRFVFTQGITGQAFRTRRSQAYSIPNGRSMAEDYSTRWSFTEDEVARLSQDRQSFYAYPIGQVEAFAKVVLYFDSADPRTFTEDGKPVLDSTIERLFLPTLERLFGMEARKTGP